MSFLYPRTVSIARTATAATAGLVSYNDLEQETTVASGLEASIQLKKEHGKPAADLPGDALERTLWTIFIPNQPITLIQSRDVVIDETGVRYQILAPYWNSLGYNLLTERLEA